MFPISRQGTFGESAHLDTRTYHDKYVIHYDFSSVDDETAKAEFTQLVRDVEGAGLQTEVRAGQGHSLLIFARANKEILNPEIHKSRVKDWLWGVTAKQPVVDHMGKGANAFEAESLLSVYHLVTWSKANGGAGITPGHGQWENVKSVFPIHNGPANRALLKQLSQKFFLSKQDFDQIRDLFGSKVAFYFAYMQSYILFMIFPAVTGIFAWAFLPNYSLAFAITTLLGCTIFLEYWKLQEADLSIRWDVKGVGSLKVNRPGYKWEKVIVDAAGRTRHYYPKWKALMRQLLQFPFFAVALVFLGAVITAIYALEVIISEVYHGPHQWMLEYVPTMLLAACLPYTKGFLEDIATALADFENHRTADNYEMSVTQKTFVLSFIVQYMPILLTAFVYVPLGDSIVPWLQARLPVGDKLDSVSFERDSDRLRHEVIALTLTGQVSDMIEELVVPYVMHKLRNWYTTFWQSRKGSFSALAPDEPSEEAFLQSVRQQASLPEYNVQEDISEMVIQFGYLALFAPVWPLVSIGFFINNLVELRSDFLKICIEHRRPDPVRSEGIGPWINSLDALTWLGSICTSAIVHMFGTGAAAADDRASVYGRMGWWSLPITIFIGEHVFMLLRVAVRSSLQKIGSEQIRRERDERYASRKKYLDELETQSKVRAALDVGAVQRRKSVRMLDPDLFWTKQVEEGVAADVGVKLISMLGRTKGNAKAAPSSAEKED